jgi:site-specific recombinase XerD
MLTIYRRHKKDCDHRAEGRKYRRCQCPIWVDGFVGGTEIRRSLGTRDWQKAQGIKDKMESAADPNPPAQSEPEPVTLFQAWDAFQAEAVARSLREPTLSKYRLLRRRMEAFAQERGLRFIAEFDLALCREFRATWKQKNLAALKTLERMRAFFGFCQEAEWLPRNPAKKVKNPQIVEAPTLPFTREEWVKIVFASEDYKAKYPKAGLHHCLRLKALILLLRYSGLRIRDAVTLSRDRIKDNRLELYTAKTGTPVCCVLPDRVLTMLECVPMRGAFYFWSGESKPKSAVGDWQRTLRNLFKVAGVKNGHAHRFRDTFAVELLLAGVPMEDVSILLGHKSIRVTQKHYSPWVQSRQDRLEANVAKTWRNDEFLKGTREVHGESRAVN